MVSVIASIVSGTIRITHSFSFVLCVANLYSRSTQMPMKETEMGALEKYYQAFAIFANHLQLRYMIGIYFLYFFLVSRNQYLLLNRSVDLVIFNKFAKMI